MIDSIQNALDAYIESKVIFECQQCNNFDQQRDDEYYGSHDYYADEINETLEELNRAIEDYAMISYKRGKESITQENKDDN